MTTKGTEYINTYNRKRKRIMIESFGGKCNICGYNKCITALEFHHLNPEEKDITLSGSIYSWEKTKEELKKCICVCANCHREIHEGLIDLDTSKQYFNEELVEDYFKNKSKIVYDLCPVCGKEKLVTHKYCSHKCACKKINEQQINNHCKDIYDWSNYDVIDMIDNKKISIRKISKMVGCSWDAVKKRYKKLKNNIDK